MVIRELKRLFSKRMIIDSKEKLEEAAVYYGMLPFFSNNIKGYSVEEMCAPGMLFGGNIEEGCWEWKGPVVRERTTAYGKFFKRKAGFVASELLPDFLNYRRSVYPVAADSTEEMLLEIIRENDGMTSTELKETIFGRFSQRRNWNELIDRERSLPMIGKRKSLEGPLQKLQMGGWLIISDFIYKKTRRGERYGWGVAQYSTPELTFGENFNGSSNAPEESLEFLVSRVRERFPFASKKELRHLLA